MAARILSKDEEIQIVEYRLTEWGRLSRQLKDNLGFPRSSAFVDVADHVKKWKRKAEEQWGTYTARGKQKHSFKPIDVDLRAPDWFMDIDREVATLPNWMAKPIRRAYLWGQPDRIAAREMRISREEFTSARDKAVSYIAKKLAQAGKL